MPYRYNLDFPTQPDSEWRINTPIITATVRLTRTMIMTGINTPRMPASPCWDVRLP